jgi:hypothetical protein
MSVKEKAEGRDKMIPEQSKSHSIMPPQPSKGGRKLYSKTKSRFGKKSSFLNVIMLGSGTANAYSYKLKIRSLTV